MFDIIKAANAANKKVNNAKALSTLMRRLQSLTVAQIQWRTMGKDTEIVSAFLDELGFKCGEDYEKYTSCLDDRVVDFKWNPAGKISELCDTVCDMRSKHPQEFSALPVVAWLKPSEPLHWGTEETPEEPESTPAAVESESSWPVRLESVTKAKIDAVIPIVRSLLSCECSEGDLPSPEHPWIDVEVRPAYDSGQPITFFNGVSYDTLESLCDYIMNIHHPSVVIPDLWVAEAINRLLPPDAASSVPLPDQCPSIPDNMMFGLFGVDEDDDDDDDRPRVKKHSSKVLMRYFGVNDVLKGVNVLQSGIAVQELINPPYTNRRPLSDFRDHVNALGGYLTNDVTVTRPLDVSRKPIAFAVTTCAFARDLIAEAFARGTDPSYLWCYIQWIYMQFFGPSFHVGIEPHARVAFGPSINAWSDRYGTWSPVLEAQAGLFKTPVVTFAFVVTPLPISSMVDPRECAPRINSIKIRSKVCSTPDEEYAALAEKFRTPADDAALWFTLTHFGKVYGELKNIRQAYATSMDIASANLARFRASYCCEAFSGRVKDLSQATPSNNSRLQPKVDQHGDLQFNLASGLLAGVAAVVKGNCLSAESSPSPNLINAVYSYIGDRSDVESLGSLAPSEVDDWLAYISASRQFYDFPRTEDNRFIVVYETDVDLHTESVACDQLVSDIKDIVHSTLSASRDDSIDPFDYRGQARTMTIHTAEDIRAISDRWVDSSKYPDMSSDSRLLTSMCAYYGRNLPDNAITVKICPNSRGKMIVVIAIRPRYAAIYLALYCVRAGLPFAMADWVSLATDLSDSVTGDIDGAVVFDNEAQLRRKTTAVEKIVHVLLRSRVRNGLTWTCNRISSCNHTWGYGPLHSCFHIRNEYDSVARRDYLDDEYTRQLRFTDVVCPT